MSLKNYLIKKYEEGYFEKDTENPKPYLSYAHFANDINIKPQELNRILNQNSTPKRGNIPTAICAKFGLTMEQYLQICDEGNTKPHASESEDLWFDYDNVRCGSFTALQKEFKNSFPNENWDVSRFASLMQHNDMSTYPHLFIEKTNGREKITGTVENWENILRKRPDSSLFFFLGNECIGDVSLFIMNDDYYEKLLTGEFYEKLMTVDKFENFAGEYTFFLLNIRLLDAYSTLEAPAKLIDTLCEMLIRYKNHGIKAKRLVIRLLSSDADERNFIKYIGFQKSTTEIQDNDLKDYPLYIKELDNISWDSVQKEDLINQFTLKQTSSTKTPKIENQ